LETKFQASQLETHKALKQVQDTIDRLQNQLNIDAHDADGIQVWRIHHRHPEPINCPLIYEEFSGEEYFAERMFSQNAKAD
jgi:hypothetical protein